MIDLTMLRYFTSAFETGTFSQAARANGVSQPTVSAAIHKLEDRLGAPLFQRSRAGLTPTPLARRLYHDAEQSVTHLSTLETRLQDRPQRLLRLYCGPDMLIRGLAPRLGSLRRAMPDLVLAFADSAQDSDIAYLSEPCLPEGHSFLPLAEEPFRVAVARNHPLASADAVGLEDLRRHPLIHRPYCPGADRMELGVPQVTAAAQAGNDTQLLELVAAGLGIAFVPASHAEGREDIILLPLTDADAGRRRIGISHRQTAFAKAAADRLGLG